MLRDGVDRRQPSRIGAARSRIGLGPGWSRPAGSGGVRRGGSVWPGGAKPPDRAASRRDREVCVAGRPKAPDLRGGRASSGGSAGRGHPRGGLWRCVTHGVVCATYVTQRDRDHSPYPAPTRPAETPARGQVTPRAETTGASKAQRMRGLAAVRQETASKRFRRASSERVHKRAAEQGQRDRSVGGEQCGPGGAEPIAGIHT